MRIKLQLFLCLFLLLTLVLPVKSQVGNFSWAVPVTVTNNTGAAQAGYQVRLKFNSAALISAGKLASDGRDLRFGDPCGANLYPYWIEKDLNTDTTIIWIKLDSIGLGSTLDFQMYYGDSSVSAMSSFSSTFPNALVTTGNMTLSGGSYDWVMINPGHTVTLQTGVVNTLQARAITVNGTIMGAGEGYQSPGTSSVGAGPGGGAWGTSSGAGAGSYGGLGGIGGYDSGDPINQPGPVYGTTTGIDLDMGSNGGNAPTVVGGDGGGAIKLIAEWVSVNGTINCNGGLAQQPGGGQGGGGGSGGGILLQGGHVNFTGTMTANGNGGSIGTITANDDGGGGGGGRIKLFYDQSLVNTGTMSVNGGPGGVNGGAGQGAPGSVGTTYVDTMAFQNMALSLGTEMANTAETAPVVTAPGTGCDGDPVTISLSGGFSSYSFTVDTTLAQSGQDSVFTFSPTVSQTVYISTVGVCGTYLDTVNVGVAPNPAPSISGGSGSFCMGDTVALSVSGSFTSYLWSNGGTASSTNAFTSGSYSVTVTDANGCMGSDTVLISVNPLPNPVITQNGFLLSTTQTFSSYQWNFNTNPVSGATSQSYTATQTGAYSVLVTDANGCSALSDTVNVIIIGLNPESALAEVMVYPNPFTRVANISLQVPAAGILTLEVFDLTGRFLSSKVENVNQGIWKHALDLREAPAGVYLARMEINGASAVVRLVKL
ncbi:MAG: DUF2341 domain-containing protein [Bacteroidia bacterium]|nr:DUF2341 domain-containing protein [Bacteroidia bacterium]